jgi:putative chitinase
MDRLLSKLAFTSAQISHLCLCTHSSAERFYKHLNHAMEYYDINTPARVAMFLSQCSYDSLRFVYTEDNLGLSTKQLMALFPARFPTTASCEGYALNPKALAEYLYAGKYGNDAPGDAWLYRPRGLRRIIGKTCYHAAQDGLGMVLTEAGADRVAEPQEAAWTAAWYWCASKLNECADKLDLAEAIKRMSNDPANGATYVNEAFDDRAEMWEYAQGQILAVIEGRK